VCTPFRQAQGGGVGEAARCVDLGGDHLAVHNERGAERLDARAGEPLAGVVSLMRGGWSSYLRVKRVVHSEPLPRLSWVRTRR
jgi:hypothetical protein